MLYANKYDLLFSFFEVFFELRMMDVEKCDTTDMNSKKQNGKNISRGSEAERKRNKKLVTRRKPLAVGSPHFEEHWLLEQLALPHLTSVRHLHLLSLRRLRNGLGV